MPKISNSITYLRDGRKLRASGVVVTRDGDLTKVKPARDDWGHVWITAKEIEAGKEKPPYVPREKREEAPDKPKRKRKPKPVPLPRWKQLVEHVRAAERDSRLFPGITMTLVVELADELESAQTIFHQKP